MSGFAQVERVVVPPGVVRTAHGHLRHVGRQGREGFALWAGIHHDHVFYVREAYIPVQQAWHLPSGVCVTVDALELHTLNVWLFQRGLSLIAQLHSHPTNAYHSETDDSFPIVTTIGGLSLVVPDFAQRPFSLAECAIYRLLPGPTWAAIPTPDAARLIVIEE